MHNLIGFASAGQLEKVLLESHQLVEYFNDAELSLNPLGAREYQLFLLAHLIVLDTVNAQFLWKRVPKALKATTEGASAPTPKDSVLAEIWGVGKALTNKLYPEAFKGISAILKTLQNDSE